MSRQRKEQLEQARKLIDEAIDIIDYCADEFRARSVDALDMALDHAKLATAYITEANE